MTTNHIRKASSLLNRASLHNDLDKAERDVERLKKELADAEAEVERLKKETDSAEKKDDQEEVTARLDYNRIYTKARTQR